MRQQGMVLNIVTSSALMSASEKGKRPQQVLEVFQDVKWEGALPTMITFGALISASEKSERPEQAVEVF